MCLGVRINLRLLEKREILFIDKWRSDKLMTLRLTNLHSYLPSNAVAALDSFSREE